MLELASDEELGKWQRTNRGVCILRNHASEFSTLYSLYPELFERQDKPASSGNSFILYSWPDKEMNVKIDSSGTSYDFSTGFKTSETIQNAIWASVGGKQSCAVRDGGGICLCSQPCQQPRASSASQ